MRHSLSFFVFAVLLGCSETSGDDGGGGSGASGGAGGSLAGATSGGASGNAGSGGSGGTSGGASGAGTGGASGSGAATGGSAGSVAGAGAGGASGGSGASGAGAGGSDAGASGSAGASGASGAGAGGSAGSAGTGGTGGAMENHWVGSWCAGPQLTEQANLPPTSLGNNTLRQIVHVTLSGAQIRVQLSNEFSSQPVTMNKVHVALATTGNGIDANTDRELTFSGQPDVTIPGNQAVYSDPLDFDVTALTKLALTIHFGSVPTDITGHPGSRTTSYIQSGDAVSAATLASPTTTDHWYFITRLDVMAPATSGAVVVLGDSITDGRGSTTNGNDRWPDALARRMQANAATAGVAVLNQGIGGNAVVTGGIGPTATARFERDVLGQSGVKWIIVLEGVNDIGGSSSASVATDLIAAYQGFIDAAHERGLLIYGAPILPFGGSDYDSTAHEMARTTVNEWIRAPENFDAVIDLDAAVRDPSAPNTLLSAYDTGDNLHLNPAGYEAMADAVDLGLFAVPTP